jgi:alpha-amylase
MRIFEYRSVFVRLICSAALALLTCHVSASARADVILHAFEWSYSGIAAAAHQLKQAGYAAVLVAPPMKSEKSSSCDWYKRYQPQDFRVVDGCNGNKEDFVKMIAALGRENLRVYADVVLNHMANERDASTTFPGQEALTEYAQNPSYWAKQRLFGDLSKGLFGSQDFHPEACIGDYGDPHQVVHRRICGQAGDRGVPDLKDTVVGQNWVLDQRKEYLLALFALGVRGFRLDAAKHMPIGAIRYFVPDSIANKAQVFGEIITWGGASDHEYNLYLKPYLQQLPASFGAYDFPLLNTLKRAFEPGQSLGANLANPYADGNALEWQRAVTVVTTHDIPTTFRSLILNPKDEELAYAYVLGRDGGTPLVFDDGSRERFEQGRWVDAWKRDVMKGMIFFHNRMQGKWMEAVSVNDCALLWRRQEDGIAAINKCGFDQFITVDTRQKFKWNVTYRDALSNGGNTFQITGPLHTFHIPARSARMWYAN